MSTTDFRPVGLLARRLDQLLDQHLDTTLRRYGVTRRQWQLLRTITAGEPVTALAPFLADGETADDHLTPLAEFVHPAGGSYVLTDSGHELMTTLTAAVRATRAVVTDGISADDYRQALNTLETMIGNLEAARAANHD